MTTKEIKGTALVTGASRGLGRAFSRALAAKGLDLVISARSGDKLENLAEELRSTHDVQINVIAMDLGEKGAAGRLVGQMVNEGQSIDLLVNNVGFGDQGRFQNLPLDRQLESIRLQNELVVDLTNRLLPAMIEKKSGGIINVSSMAGFQPIPYAAVYSASKAFLTTFSLALEAEMSSLGIRVVTVCPGRLARLPDELDGGERKKVPGGEQSYELVIEESLRKLESGGGLVIPGGVNKFAAFAGKLVPRSKIAGLTAKLSKPPE